MKAIKAGRITPEPDGTIDPVKADRQWGVRTDPAQQRVRKSAFATKPVPKSAIRAVDETLGDTGGGEVSFLRARMANEVLKAQTATQGTGPARIKVGRRVFYRKSAVEKWLKSQVIGGDCR